MNNYVGAEAAGTGCKKKDHIVSIKDTLGKAMIWHGKQFCQMYKFPIELILIMAHSLQAQLPTPPMRTQESAAESVQQDMLGQVWIGLDRFGQVWDKLDRFGIGLEYIWICLNRFGYVWIGLDRIGQDWIGLDRIGQDWIGL